LIHIWSAGVKPEGALSRHSCRHDSCSRATKVLEHAHPVEKGERQIVRAEKDHQSPEKTSSSGRDLRALFLAGILIAVGVVIAHYFSGTFSLGAWIAGVALFVFA
jgi:hypothetical protein